MNGRIYSLARNYKNRVALRFRVRCVSALSFANLFLKRNMLHVSIERWFVEVAEKADDAVRKAHARLEEHTMNLLATSQVPGRTQNRRHHLHRSQYQYEQQRPDERHKLRN